MIIYQHGRFTRGDVHLPPLSPAIHHGAGFCESVLYNGIELCHLSRHLDRVLSSLRVLGLDYRAVDFEDVALKLLGHNGLLGEPARVDILHLIMEDGADPVLMATPFEPKPYKAYRLCLCEDPNLCALDGLRTTNTMFGHLELRLAQRRGFDDVALLDPEGNILRATTGALVLCKQDQFVCVDSPFSPPSIALDLAKTVLDIQPRQLPLERLGSFRHAYILNSLIGMRPVVAMGETAFVPDEDACNKVMDVVLADVRP